MDFWLNRNGMILSCRCVQHWMPHGDTIVGRNDFPVHPMAILFFQPHSHLHAHRVFRLRLNRFNTLFGAEAFRLRLLELIAGAEKRIYLTALYLQDDEAGREVLDALHAAKALRPGLDIRVLVDWHRAQRGLIGAGSYAGNAGLVSRGYGRACYRSADPRRAGADP